MSQSQEVRAALERREASLSPFAARSSESRGREHSERPSPVRLEFQRDRDRIIHCKSFRRLKNKTHVFIAPMGDHYVTRLTHTLEVAQIGRTIARALNLNEDLTEAVTLGHDLGHTPFGHRGEDALSELLPEGFSHNEQSLRVVERLERGGQGLNLTWEVRDGILHHSKSRHGVMETESDLPATLEGQIARLADAIAYLNHDIADAIRAGLLSDDDLPDTVRRVLGSRHSQRINTLVCDIVDHSWAATGLLGRDVTPAIGMSPEVLAATDELREFMFQRVYLWEDAQPAAVMARRLVSFLFDYYLAHPDEISSDFTLPSDPPWRRVADYIAGMTDTFAIDLGSRLGFET
jgi:dGTPase